MQKLVFYKMVLRLHAIKNYYGQNYLFIVKSILKIIIHVLKLLQKNLECLTSKPIALGTF